MAAAINLRSEEKIGLIVAVAAHLAVFAGLGIHALREPAQIPLPERMVVSLADEVALTSTAPNPSLEAQAAIAPTLSDTPSPPVVERVPDPPRPAPPVTRPPEPKVEKRPDPKPAPKPTPAPRKQADPPKPKPQPKAPAPKPATPPKATPPKAQPETPPKRTGGSRIGNDFLAGQSGGERTEARGTPAEAFGPQQQASLRSAISRQLRQHWNAPQGVDAELLVTLLDWDLNPDGSLAGRPRLKSQSGINDSNRPQAARHAELAIRAVQLAAPFNLPAEHYDQWKRIRSWRFDRNTSQ